MLFEILYIYVSKCHTVCWLLVCVIYSRIVSRCRRLVLRNKAFEVGCKPQVKGCFCCQFSFLHTFWNVVRTAGQRNRILCSGTSGGWERYQNEIRKLGCKWKQKRSVKVVNIKSRTHRVCGYCRHQAQNWRPAESRIIVQYLESLQPIKSEPLASIPRHPSNKMCLSEGPVVSPTSSNLTCRNLQPRSQTCWRQVIACCNYRARFSHFIYSFLSREGCDEISGWTSWKFCILVDWL